MTAHTKKSGVKKSGVRSSFDGFVPLVDASGDDGRPVKGEKTVGSRQSGVGSRETVMGERERRVK